MSTPTAFFSVSSPSALSAPEPFFAATPLIRSACCCARYPGSRTAVAPFDPSHETKKLPLHAIILRRSLGRSSDPGKGVRRAE
jgi:hypothetical protein